MTAAADHAWNADVLDDAADLIERAWFSVGATNHLSDDPGGGSPRHCALTAIGAASKDESTQRLAVIRVLAAHLDAKPLLLGVGVRVAAWNNRSTKQIVLDTMRAAAKSERVLADAIDANDPSP